MFLFCHTLKQIWLQAGRRSENSPKIGKGKILHEKRLFVDSSNTQGYLKTCLYKKITLHSCSFEYASFDAVFVFPPQFPPNSFFYLPSKKGNPGHVPPSRPAFSSSPLLYLVASVDTRGLCCCTALCRKTNTRRN